MAIVLGAKERKDKKHSTLRRIRSQGGIPAVLYGKKVDNKMISISAADLEKALREGGRHSLVTLKVDGEDYSVLLREVQRDPLRGELLHADFQAVDMSAEVDVDVEVRLVGEAPGVKDGGVLQQNLHELSIRVLPANIPPAIEVDISGLQVGDVITVGDVQTGGTFEINHEPSEVIATILPPQQEEEIHSGEQQEPGQPEAEEGRETTPEG
ncbi:MULTISPECIES: 50S ribosomal protein L25/general stress protein Ctc [Geobacillus]|jgi:large subunit ribosomal protein L25|uniref:Large ribosomal subunit protein bL25 n=1 Tax=Geobacillus thermodenitrificans (strain NG80-2) TaxID=420246 RepID=RL25_GEOTN|nr:MULTISPECIES: 50S ribosomal protein L25/general stress protein Ctc [Geobacillus]A4IJC8.1 RecName: Full=Large ribosomal subunit protein bL25; AltName: Full=50S ribosomal protein L25; AltName: Full=General stress protein CTC [Geobacillus thermodenitrificans NG80-2]ABO65432.1 General stress protein [Geobacillus thermodenitrificans NG80-2]ARA98114.1 50S ribosomal protein L25/general stress protein Ctc [Geobacillus thermodenitrificans]ARP41064.1 50S ribosomal protein L25 [Geobacillus thermodenitr